MFSFVTCCRCGLVYQNPRVPLSRIGEYYDEDYIVHRRTRPWGMLTPLFERARASVERLPDGPFRGVPMLLKDASQQLAGTPYYLGTQVLKSVGWRSPRTTELAARFQRACFVIAGKAAVSELSGRAAECRTA